jgi:SAM-dependent methyltransferase
MTSHRPKPRGLSQEYASQFCDASVADAYAQRPPYPAEVFEILASLVQGSPRRVLDLGCGRGEVARGMLDRVDAIDAVDASPAMIERGRRLPGGDDAKLQWTVARAEEAALCPPYGLIVAASSLHWMDWDVVLPRLCDALLPGAFLALFDDQTIAPPWSDRLNAIIPRYSTNREFEPYRLIDELELRGLFRSAGSRMTGTVAFAQDLDAYLESFHSRNGFSRQRQAIDDAQAFDDAVREMVEPYAINGRVELRLCSTVQWGWPCP